MSLCQLCGDFHAYPGFIACDACLDELGDDPEKLEQVAAHRALIRSVRVKDNALFHALEGVRRSVNRKDAA